MYLWYNDIEKAIRIALLIAHGSSTNVEKRFFLEAFFLCYEQ